jgi:hypothetical protein
MHSRFYHFNLVEICGRDIPMSEEEAGAATSPPKKTKAKITRKAARRAPKKVSAKKGRTPRIYPVLSFEETLVLAEAINSYASGERVARLTLLKQMNSSPTSSSTQILITSSGKYGITKGSFVAEHIELTDKGRLATDKNASAVDVTQARFDLAISGIKPFEVLYNRYKGKKLPSHDVMRDTLAEADLEITDHKECIDLFIVNAKYIGLLQTIAGSETLVPIETLLEQIPAEGGAYTNPALQTTFQAPIGADAKGSKSQTQWQKICFYITPIGDEGTVACARFG